jgi:PAS domain S-box-containing protein
VLLYPRTDLANQVILAFVLGGMMLGAAFLLAPRPAAFVAFIVPTGFSLAARFLLQGDRVHVAMGLLASIFTIVTLITTWRLYLTVGSSVNLRFENQGLVEAQDALLESEERFRSLFENATVGLYRTTPDGRILMANPVLLGMLGCESFQELSRRNLEEEGFEPGYSRSEFRKLLESEGIVRGLEARWTRRDGSVLFVRESARAVRGADGRVRYCDGIVEDFTQRKWAEDTLRESEERFRAIFHQAAVGVAQTGLDGHWLLLNDRFCEILGYSPIELRGKTFVDITHPDDREASRTAVQQLLSGEISSWSKEKRYIRKDGVTIWGRLFLSLVRDGHKQPQYFIAVLEDITEKISAERAFRDAEQRLTLAQDAAHLGVWDSDLRRNIITIRGKYAQLHGLPPDRTEIMREEWLNLIHPDDRERVEALRREARERTRGFDAEFRVIWPDGSVHWFRGKGTVLVDDSRRPIRSMGVIEDVTQRKQAEAALCESEERYRSLVVATSPFVWIADVNGEFNRPQPSWESYTGQSWAQHQGNGWIAAVHPDDRARVADGWQRAVATRSLYEVEWRAWHAASGQWRYCQTRGVPVRGSDGEVREWIGAVTDVHDRKKLEAYLQKEDRLASLGILAGGIAHDFNNLLGGVEAQAELALAELDGGLHPQEELRAIRDVALRGSEIVRQLMVYAGKESAVVGPVDLSWIVKEMIELLKVSVSKHAVVETDLGKDLPTVQADAAQLRQIVMNLVTNASEAIGDRDGVILVTTRRLTLTRKFAGVSGTLPDGDYLTLEVSDTGQGIPPEIQARVFDPFFTTKSTGHGLGLAVVHGIVRGLGGAIHVASEPGKGTTFQVLLPCAETKAEATSDTVFGCETSAPHSQECTVLVVEDEGPLRQAVVKTLRKTGFEVFEAPDGSVAIDLLRANADKIDLILLDMTIPGASSSQVASEVARVRSDIRVILTSAYSQEMLTVPLSTTQIYGFVRKPFQLGDLVNTLRRASSAS